MTEPVIPVSRLRAAEARGIITRAQLDAILSGDAPASGAEGPRLPEEVSRGFNAVTIAYYAGAAAVLFAFGWFLVDRWRVLGAGGVLAVTLVYAALFWVAARVLARNGFRIAAALATLLVVGMTPLVTWSLLSLSGMWYEPPRLSYPGRYVDLYSSLRWLPIELATVLVALVAIRSTQFALLALPIAVALASLAQHLVPVLFDPLIGGELQDWMMLLASTALVFSGYVIAQREPPDEDYAHWFYLVGLVTGAIAFAELWDRPLMPHVALMVGALLVVASLYLRRRIFLFFGALASVAYLFYLAFDVFRQTLSFPILLASFGLAVILLTVLFQRRYPSIARRMDAARGPGQSTLPGGYYALGVAVAIALVLLVTAPPRERARQRERWAKEKEWARRNPRHPEAVRPSPATR